MLVQSTVPDFFQEDTPEALRSQVDWLVREVGIDAAFFERFLGTDEVTFSNWRVLAASLSPSEEEGLRCLWRMVLHLLSFLGFNRSRVRDLFLQMMPACPSGEQPHLAPPWCGTSLRAYLEQARADGIAKVEGWVTGLRFGDPYAA